MLKVYTLAITLSLCLAVFGHGEVHERIRIVGEEITAAPEDASLYVKRAYLYLEDGDFDMTIADLNFAQELEGESYPPLLMCSSEMYHKLGANEAALKYIDAFLDEQPFHVLGFRTKAQILESLNDIPAAIDYYKKVVIHTTTPLPENYLSIIDNLSLDDRVDEAVFYCKEAMRTFGPILTFQEKLIDIYMEAGRYHEAIVVLDGIIQKFERKEGWYFKKANLCLEMGSPEMATSALGNAHTSLQALPQRLKATPAMKQLAEQIGQTWLTLDATSNEITESTRKE